VKKTATLSLLILLTLAFAGGGCRGRQSSAASGTAQNTQTIAPAAAQPGVNGGDAVTQTVDVEDGRSEDDGGLLTNPQTAKTPGATTTAKPKPAAKKKH
jgi:hypothetical protein